MSPVKGMKYFPSQERESSAVLENSYYGDDKYQVALSDILTTYQRQIIVTLYFEIRNVR